MTNKFPLELLILFNKNDSETQKKLIDLINDPLSNSDGPGFVYGYHKDDRNLRSNFWMKMGRTAREDPSKRVVNEWGGNMIFCHKSSFNIRFERFVHLFFRYANEIRHIDGHNQIEWFHFIEKINVAMYVAIIFEFVEDQYNQSQFYISDSQQVSAQKPIGLSSIKSKVNINTATKSELMQLPGIGDIRADKIINHRTTHRFTVIKDITHVNGIANGIFDKIQFYITV